MIATYYSGELHTATTEFFFNYFSFFPLLKSDLELKDLELKELPAGMNTTAELQDKFLKKVFELALSKPKSNYNNATVRVTIEPIFLLLE